MPITREQAMTIALSLLAQYNEGKTAINLPIPGEWQLASHNTLLRWALRAIADYGCRCADLPADDGDLCPACFAKSMLEPMPAERVQAIFKVKMPEPPTVDDPIDVPPGAVATVAGAGGVMADDDD